MKTLLQIGQEFLSRTGLPASNSFVGNPNGQLSQIVSLCNEVCEEITSRGVWQALQQESVFTTVNGENQGALATLAPNGFLYILNQTIYNRTLRLPIYGPMTPEQWQALKALPTTGPFYKYRIRDGNVLFNPLGIAGQVCAFEYASNASVLSSVSGLNTTWFTNDQDQFLLDSSLMMAGLRWKWKYEQGLLYSEDFTRFEILVNNALGRDGSKPQLKMDSGVEDYRPGIMVPAGNWNV